MDGEVCLRSFNCEWGGVKKFQLWIIIDINLIIGDQYALDWIVVIWRWKKYDYQLKQICKNIVHIEMCFVYHKR